MEFFTIFLASVLGLLSPVGVVADRVATSAIRQNLDAAEQLSVRIDSAPSYQLIQGRADRILIAGRGIYPIKDVRIAALDVETDPIAVNPSSFRNGRLRLDRPLQAGVRLELTTADIERALRSHRIASKLRDLSLNGVGESSSEPAERYDVVNPQVTFLPNHRIRVQVALKGQRSGYESPIVLETGLNIISGKQLELVDLTASLNNQPVPAQLIQLLTSGITQTLDLSRLEKSGVTARVLKLEIEGDRLMLAAFVRIDPKFTNSRS